MVAREPDQLIVLSADGLKQLDKKEAKVGQVGVKAHGLLGLSPDWVPQFFVVTSDLAPTQAQLYEAGASVGIGPTDPVYVRSSGTAEGLLERGSLDSERATLETAGAALEQLRSRLGPSETVHFIVQRRVRVEAKGHLSNERRIAEKSRDWVCEIEPTASHAAESGSAAVRKWRQDDTEVGPLTCALRANIFRTLRQVAARAGNVRLHFEWVWDGERVWVVQQDSAIAGKGQDPRALVADHDQGGADPTNSELLHFRRADHDDFIKFPKLKNARLYSELGYEMPPFFILDDHDFLRRLQSGIAPPLSLREDLEKLCKKPFVIRTDGSKIPADHRQMLPRSDELRSAQDAIDWLVASFAEKLYGLPADTYEMVLIGHNFIPAISSAWCLAFPDKRRARIESLWGIPEGLYYFSHDVFDVDTGVPASARSNLQGVKILGKRLRYKERFIAPDAEGNWIIHQTAPPADWTSSIKKQDWIREIAKTSRLIATSKNEPTVVMWFIGIPPTRSKEEIIPWYHEEWTKLQSDSIPASPHKAGRSGETYEIRTAKDLDDLIKDPIRSREVSRVAICPEEENIVRDNDFIDRLAIHAKDSGYVVELRGGLLSHVFYALRRKGCEIHCVDLFGSDDEVMEFNKLVRDAIPEAIESRGEEADVVQVRGEALLISLKQKLVEEALEVSDAKNTDAIAEEIADVLEVIEGIEAALQLTREDVQKVKLEKLAKRGGFEKGLMLLKTHLPPGAEAGLVDADSKEKRPITKIAELPAYDHSVNVDKRTIGGVSERQITMSLPIYQNSYSVARQTLDLSTPEGVAHPMRFEVSINRVGSEYKLKFRLVNNPLQLELNLRPDPVNDAGTVPPEE